MKLKKILAIAAASMMTAGALAANANALFYIPADKKDALDISDVNCMYIIHRDENPKKPEEPAIDFGVDYTKIRTATFYFEVVVHPDKEDSMTLEDFAFDTDGGFGGAVGFSANGGAIGQEKNEDGTKNELYAKQNWNTTNAEWWGLPVNGDTLEGRSADDMVDGKGGEGTNQGTVAYSKPLQMQYLSDFHYKVSRTITDEEAFIADAGLVRVLVQEWGNKDKYFSLKSDLCICTDANGEFVIAFDSLGNSITADDAKKMADELETPKADNPSGGDSTQAPSESGDESQAPSESGNESQTPANSSNSGSNTTSNNSSKGDSSNNNVGLIIGIICGVVVVIVVVVIIVIKKKK